jgi:polyhydroxyalkanoate synthesis regulator phasin
LGIFLLFMKKQSVFYSLTRVVIILTAAFFFGAQADDKKGGKDPRAGKFRAAEEKIWNAVKAGKLSKEDAQKKLTGLKKEIWGGDLKKDSSDKKEGSGKSKAKFNAVEKEIWGAVKAGKLSKEDAMKKLEGLKKEVFDEHEKKGRSGKKGQAGKSASDVEALKRQLGALKRENEGLRKRLEGRKER